jgi:hypothetical protein
VWPGADELPLLEDVTNERSEDSHCLCDSDMQSPVTSCDLTVH